MQNFWLSSTVAADFIFTLLLFLSCLFLCRLSSLFFADFFHRFLFLILLLVLLFQSCAFCVLGIQLLLCFFELSLKWWRREYLRLLCHTFSWTHIKYVKCIVSIRCVFYESTKSNLVANILVNRPRHRIFIRWRISQRWRWRCLRFDIRICHTHAHTRGSYSMINQSIAMCATLWILRNTKLHMWFLIVHST